MATVPSGQKFHTVPQGVNTQEKGSALANSQREIYTMQDVTDTVRPYKVFTALLTQSGDGSINGYVENYASSGIQNFIKGVTYYIDINDQNVDFSSIGAPNNEVGTYFIATENKLNTDFPDLTWTLGYNPSAPVATVLENTIGNVWFTYYAVGSYRFNSDGLFTENKTWQLIESVGSSGSDIGAIFYINENTLLMYSFDGGTQSDDMFSNTPIEIRVYN